MKRREIGQVFKNYERRGIFYPTSGKIPEHKNSDKYDELIAVWTAFFNEKLKTDPPLNPDIFKALLASESGFRLHTPENKIAFGIAQITKQAWEILQNPKRAAAKLGRQPTHEDFILEYKGLLKSKTSYKDKALKNYRYYYELLKSK